MEDERYQSNHNHRFDIHQKMKNLLLSLALILSANAWAGICDGPSANKPDYKEYCEKQESKKKSSKKDFYKFDLPKECEIDLSSKSCNDALISFWTKDEKMIEKKKGNSLTDSQKKSCKTAGIDLKLCSEIINKISNLNQDEIDEIESRLKCIQRIQIAQENFLKTCRAPGTIGSDVGEFIYQINYCRTQANDRYDPMSCFEIESKDKTTSYTLWVTVNNVVQKYATFRDYGSCMNRCRNLQQLCTCQAD